MFFAIRCWLHTFLPPIKKTSRRHTVNQRGAVLLMVLISVTLLGLMSGIAGSSWQTIVQRNKEVDLLWKGNAIRQAIESYYHFSSLKGTELKQYPPSLEDLLQDPRALEITRHLRRLYPDPLNNDDWELIPAPGGGIMGVKSTVDQTPFKQNGFAEQNKSFVGKQSYHDWAFTYTPTTVKKSPQTNPASITFGQKLQNLKK